mgnify:CR=1 FL=1
MYGWPCRLDDALLQNSIADIMTADLDQLGDEEPDGLAGGAAGSAAGARSSVAGAGAAGSGGGHQQERGGLTEAQTFSDLAYSKNKVGAGFDFAGLGESRRDVKQPAAYAATTTVLHGRCFKLRISAHGHSVPPSALSAQLTFAI